MNAEFLREAAARARRFGTSQLGEDFNDPRHIAVADWLEHEAAFHEELRKHGARGLDPDGIGAFAVARAYLSRSS